MILLENFSVAISYKGSLGWVEFDEATKKVLVTLGDEEGRTLAENFLTTTHEIKIPHETLLDFTAEVINPNESAENLKIVLTRLWEATGVHVDWSRPVEYVKLHPHY
ncbi:MAG: hypothetical protein IJL12_07220 [Selenomonadaceae bacterium]|nr:hypothetical protein [Selenomonadaceae bacterium]MBQ4403481.1 hypothetical protein [Selenomonadaceae bacterium]MBQ6132117.1 hypothetical protein [Selenomonadaceae bacterium]